MLKLHEVKQRLKEIEGTNTLNATPSDIKQLKASHKFLTTCKLYLETNPQESFVKSQLEQVELRIEILLDEYRSWNIKGKPKTTRQILALTGDENLLTQRELLRAILK